MLRNEVITFTMQQQLQPKENAQNLADTFFIYTGLQHEQSRPDRDLYVNIHYNNINGRKFKILFVFRTKTV